MVSPKESLSAVARAIADSGNLPAETSLLLQEADEQSDDADIEIPLLEMQIIGVDNVSVLNSDVVGFTTDSDGNQTGRVYRAEYEMTLDLRLWTVKDDTYDPDDLGRRLRDALYPYSSHGPQKPFEDENGDPIDLITYFSLGDGERVDDMISTPTVRRWSQEVELWGCEEFQTDEDFIVDVDYPSADELTGDDGTISDT